MERPLLEPMPQTTDPLSPLPLALTAPALRRGSMAPRPWSGLWSGLRAAWRGDAPVGALPASGWTAAAARRRRRLLALVLACAALATLMLEATAAAGERSPWAYAQTGLFALLFAWVAAGCVTAVMGYRSLLRGDRHVPTAAAVAEAAIRPDARTAIVMPICNEDIGTVAAGLRATCESLRTAMQREGVPEVFDVFILSDSADAALREVEQAAWQALSATFAAGAAGSAPAIRVYYRWRQRRTKKKAGNVADFCRRWGRDYRYMLVLDADSVMSGEAILSMLRVMEARPRVGILQTAPRACGHDSLHARLQQFAGRVTGALFSAGLRYWQLGESHYWGHNAILRVEPFMRHCALAPLPGTGGLSGAILSHDFVEAALMRRAGYEVWLAPDIEGSFEQPPPHLLDELQRDRRWCQGNLQNARLVAEPGLAPVHRAMFVTGAMSYLASPLWLAFALIGLLPWLADGAVAAEPALPLGALLLWGLTLALLFVPRVLAVRLVMMRGEQAAYGGTRKLIASAVLEALLSALLAPVRMLAHSLFVLGALTGLKLQWKSPSREATDVGWREAAARFGISGVLAVGVCAWWLAGQPQEAWRVLPLALPLALAVPLAVLSSRRSLGLACKRRGWLLTPEESRTPPVLRQAHAQLALPPSGAETVAPVSAQTARPTPVGTALAWSGRGVALAGLAAGLMALALPRPVANGGLSSADLAALRIVMQAQSPSAAPRVLVQRPARMTRVSDTELRRPRRVTSI